MARWRLRTRLLVTTLLVLAALTSAHLLIIRRTVRAQVEQQASYGITASVSAFESVQQQRGDQLSRTAALLSELPPLKALMTTAHGPTIQDASVPFWRLAGSDLMALAGPDGRILGLHGLPAARLPRLQQGFPLASDVRSRWWYDDHRLFQMFVQPITSGGEANARLLGYITVGYEVDDQIADDLSRVAGSEITLLTADSVIASTLPRREWDENTRRSILARAESPASLSFGGRTYQAASVLLANGPPVPVYCFVLMPTDRWDNFLDRINSTILILGIAGFLVAALLIILTSRSLTRPLDDLVAAVRALANDDFGYRIQPRGSPEIAELGRSFAAMRTQLQESQRLRIEAARVAALGRMASSISHDLRHYLAAVVANSEFLYEAESLKLDRAEVYQEIKTASEQMVDLIDSLRELSGERNACVPVPANLAEIARRAIDAVHARPEFRAQEIRFTATGDLSGAFDPRKIERAVLNLVLNACEAAARPRPEVSVELTSAGEWLEVRVRDNGPGIPESIRNSMFDPFVSAGKSNGTGLGLAIVHKIGSDHGGSVQVEGTSAKGTVMLLRLPRSAAQPGTETPARQSVTT
ncbi:MAG: ATP-binding protein [Candidatus Korobacteraceae bacterium]